MTAEIISVGTELLLGNILNKMCIRDRGTNVLGRDTDYSSFLTYYRLMLDMLSQTLPNAKIYVPVSYTHLDVYKRQGPSCATWTPTARMPLLPRKLWNTGDVYKRQAPRQCIHRCQRAVYGPHR